MAKKKNNLIFETLRNTVWAIHPKKMEEIAAFIENRMSGEKTEDFLAAAEQNEPTPESGYEVKDGVAVIEVYGVLSKRMNMLTRFSGGTSTEKLAEAIKQAAADPEVDAILLDIDSPGGTVDGTKEVADIVYATRFEKPVVAYANGQMASGAYWIGSAATNIVAPETAEIGSIGVALMHYDFSEQDKMRGVKRTSISAGKYKRIASDEKPLSEEGAAYLQEMVDDYYQLFISAVARNRGADPETVHERMADGRDFIAVKAVKRNMIDQINTMDGALALAKQLGGSMDIKALNEKYPELVKEIESGAHSRGYDDGHADGVKTERVRAVEIMEAGADAEETLAAVKAGTPAPEAYKAFFLAEKKKKADALEEMRTAAPPFAGSEPPKEPEAEKQVAPDRRIFKKAAEIAKTENVSMEQATVLAMARDPELNKAYRESLNP